MNYNKKNVEDIAVAGKTVLVRCDFNVPLKDGVITSDKRIVEALPTIKYLMAQGAKVILCSHMGKPKGEVVAKYSLAPVAARLTELLGVNVPLAADTIGEDAKAKAAALKNGDVMLLENTRFDKREEKNDPEFAKEMASMAEVYVNDVSTEFGNTPIFISCAIWRSNNTRLFSEETAITPATPLSKHVVFPSPK